MLDTEKRIQCPRCKSYIPEEHKFCSYCGLRLKKEEISFDGLPSTARFRKSYLISVYISYKWKIGLTPELLNKFNLYVYNVEKLCEKYGGFLEKFTHLNGTLAIFGYENFNNELPKNVIDFTFEVEELIKKSFGDSLEYGIGVCAGWSFFGEIEINNPVSITAIGDCINTSARLSTLFSNKKYVCSDVYDSIVDYFTFEDLGKVKFKGKFEKINVYSVLGKRKERVKRKFETFYVEREDIKGIFNNILREWKEGKSRTVFLSGEAGIGKSFLMEILAKELKEKYFTITFKGDESKQVETLYPFKKFVSDAINNKKFNFVRNHLNNFLRMIQSIEGELSDKLIFNRIKYLIFDIFRIILNKKGKLVILFDDIDKCDSATYEILNLFSSKFDKNFLMILAGRIIPIPLDLRNLYKIRLRAFEFEETKEFLKNYFPEVTNEVALEVHNKTGGIPLYISQYVKSLIIKGEDINRQTELPLSFISFVLSPIQHLSDELREILELLSVVSELDLESPLTKIFKEDFEKKLTSLIIEDLIRMESNKVYFVNPLVREVLYESLPPGVKESMHREIVDAVHNTKWGDENPYFVFHHALKAKNYAIAWEYGIKSISKFMKEGIGFIPRIIFEKLENEVLKNYKVKPMDMGDYFYWKGRYNFISRNFEKAIQDFHKALLLTDEEDPKWNEINLFLAKSYIERGNLVSSRKFLRDIKLKDEIISARTYTAWSDLHKKAGELFDSLIFIRRANKELSKRGIVLSELRIRMADLLLWTGNLEEALNTIKEAEYTAFVEMNFENVIEAQKIKSFLGYLMNYKDLVNDAINTGKSYSEKFENVIYLYYFDKINEISNNISPKKTFKEVDNKELVKDPYIFFTIKIKEEEKFIKNLLKKEVIENPNIPIFQKIYLKSIKEMREAHSYSSDIRKVMENAFKYPIPVVHIFILKDLIKFFKSMERFDIVKYLLKNYLYIFEDISARIRNNELREKFRNHFYFNPEKILEKV